MKPFTLWLPPISRRFDIRRTPQAVKNYRILSGNLIVAVVTHSLIGFIHSRKWRNGSGIYRMGRRAA